MPDEKRGLKRPKAPVDIFTLQPEPDLVPGTEEVEATSVPKPMKRSKARATSTRRRSPKQSKGAAGKKSAAPRAERIKTSVELLPETIDLIEQIKSQHRREHRRHFPMWKILDEAVRELAKRRLPK